MIDRFRRFINNHRRSGRRKFVLVAPPGVAVISGVTGTGQAGTVTAAIATGELQGVVGTGAAGTVIPQVSNALVGASATGQAGILTIQQGPIGVAGIGQVGSVTKAVLVNAIGVSALGLAGNLQISYSVTVAGVSAAGFAGDVFPIPPAPSNRPPLFIPEHDRYPPSLWLGNTNG